MGNSNDISKIKCRIAVSTIIVVACVTLMACGNTSGSSKYNKKMSDDELKMAIVENNKNSEIIQNGEFLKSEQIVGIDGERTLEVITGPDGYFAMFTNWGDNNVTSGHISYGSYNYAPEKKIVRVYDDELWQYQEETRLLGDFDEVYRADEEYLEREIRDGKLYIKARYLVSERDEEALAGYGVDTNRDIEYIESNREFDLDTLRMISLTEAIKYADENESIVYTVTNREYSKENPSKEKDDEIYNEVFGNPTHTIKIIAKVGTADEKEYEITANENTVLDYWIKDSNDMYDVFDDPECTVPAEVDEDSFIKFDRDKVLYMK